jgi:hypothetical protein
MTADKVGPNVICNIEIEIADVLAKFCDFGE